MPSYTSRINLRATFMILALFDKLGIYCGLENNEVHLKETIDWLKRAQNSTEDGGVSAGYFDQIGWDASYPETTGYIIPTFFEYARFSQDIDCKKRAIEMSDFLIGIQKSSGAFLLGSFGAFPLGGLEVFDTGQIMQGLIRCYEETKREKYLTASIKAGDWIVKVQDRDGAWRKFSYRGKPHTFYTRVSLALLELFNVVGDLKYKEAAIRNVEWALTNCNENGWYKNCGAEDKLMSNPSTHFIAYAAEGILDCGIKLKNEFFTRSATRTMNSILAKFKQEGWIKGTYDENWKSTDVYSCLTGDAQIALIWLRLFELTKNQIYYDCANAINNILKSTQYLHHWNINVKGGIKGSHPIYGDYNSYRYLNWAAKFFVDLQLRFISLNLR